MPNYELIASFLSLSLLEIVLSIDNVVFIAIVIAHLPDKTRYTARTIAVSLALLIRFALLFALSWLVTLDNTLFTIGKLPISGKSIFLFAGGLFLIAKCTTSIHEMFTHSQENELKRSKAGFWGTVAQAIFIDLVFSFDSIVAAIGITSNIPVIIAAMTISMIAMLFFVKIVSTFIEDYPTLKILAISFILVIGIFLIGESFGLHIPRGYIYFAMAFSLFVETLNIVFGKKNGGKRR